MITKLCAGATACFWRTDTGAAHTGSFRLHACSETNWEIAYVPLHVGRHAERCVFSSKSRSHLAMSYVQVANRAIEQQIGGRRRGWTQRVSRGAPCRPFLSTLVPLVTLHAKPDDSEELWPCSKIGKRMCICCCASVASLNNRRSWVNQVVVAVSLTPIASTQSIVTRGKDASMERQQKLTGSKA